LRTPCLALAVLLSSAIACADVIYETDDPFGGPFGIIGSDVCDAQSVAVRFTPDIDYRFEQVGVWFMNNDFSGKTHPLVTVSLRPDLVVDGESIPSEEIIESWEFNVSAVGWDPMLETLVSKLQPTLEAGANYWIVCESEAPCGLDGVWNWAGIDSGFTSICNGIPCEWSSGSGAVNATIVEGTPVIPADLDGDGSVGPADLAELLAQWGACDDCKSCPADLSGDCSVGPEDLGELLANWT
jgi:hypothetical protein